VSEDPSGAIKKPDLGSELVSGLFSGSKIDADLTQIIKVWPELPEHIKAAIMALIRTT